VYNPFTGTFDFIGSNESTSFNPDTILTGFTECLYSGPTVPLSVLIDNNGNVLTGII